jgi:uncharacterized protein (DUF486 family)
MLRTILLLTASNIFMTFAWYGNLKEPFHWKYMVSFVLIPGAVYFAFKK